MGGDVLALKEDVSVPAVLGVDDETDSHLDGGRVYQEMK